MGPCSPLLPGENFNSRIEVQLPVELENTHIFCSPTLNQWGSLGPLMVRTVSTLHGGTRFVRTKSCYKCILNLEFQESCDLLVKFKYNFHKCEVQCTAFYFK